MYQNHRRGGGGGGGGERKCVCVCVCVCAHVKYLPVVSPITHGAVKLDTNFDSERASKLRSATTL